MLNIKKKNVSQNHVLHSNHMFITAVTRLRLVTTFKQYHKPGLLEKKKVLNETSDHRWQTAEMN